MKTKSKKSPFNKWFDKRNAGADMYEERSYFVEPWNAACKSILRKVKKISKEANGFPQEEDLGIIEEEIKEMIEK